MTGSDELGELFSAEKKVTLSTQSSLQQDENLDERGLLYRGGNEYFI